MSTTGRFEGKTALVTGAGRGIGRAVALGLAAKGAHVALLSRTQSDLDETKAAVQDRGGVAITVQADIGDQSAVERAARETLAEFGAVDILINNAGVVWPLGPSTSIDTADWSAAIGVNVIGTFNLTLALLPRMLERSWGRIVNVSSGIAAQPAKMIGGNAYATSKAALEAHTLNLAAELAGTGVTVNVYRPGRVDTAMQRWIRTQPAEKIGVELHDRFVKSYEQGVLTTPLVSAQSLLERLASDATGEIWSVGEV